MHTVDMAKLGKQKMLRAQEKFKKMTAPKAERGDNHMITKVAIGERGGKKERRPFTSVFYTDDDSKAGQHNCTWEVMPPADLVTALSRLSPYIVTEVMEIPKEFMDNHMCQVHNVVFTQNKEVTDVYCSMKIEMSDGRFWTPQAPKFCWEVQSEELKQLLADLVCEAETFLDAIRAEGIEPEEK